MTEVLADLTVPSDAELISRVRGGDTDAYGALFARHKEAAVRLARQLARGSEVDDLVSEAFTKVLQVLLAGGGPDIAFRAYLLTAVRRLHVDHLRAAKRVQPSEQMEDFDAGIPFRDTVAEGFERSVTARAFASLPERWQVVLWHVEVEGQKPADVAPLLGISANSVSALAYRAREGLRQAYLQMHLADTAGEQCRWTTEHLGTYVRGGLSRRDASRVDHHLEECRRCTGVYLELTEVNSNLRGLLAPILLGTLAPGYLAATSAGGAGLLGAAGLFDRITDGIKGMGSNAAIAGGVAGAVVATGLIALAVTGDDPGSPSPRAVAPRSTATPTPSSTPSRSPSRTRSPKAQVAAPPETVVPQPATPPATASPTPTSAPPIATVNAAPPPVREPPATAPPRSEPPRPGVPPTPTRRRVPTADLSITFGPAVELGRSVNYRVIVLLSGIDGVDEAEVSLTGDGLREIEVPDLGGWWCVPAAADAVACRGSGVRLSFEAQTLTRVQAALTASIRSVGDEIDPVPGNDTDTISLRTPGRPRLTA
jgi:RNA polymerase sigma factor (sigma-70 family)